MKKLILKLIVFNFLLLFNGSVGMNRAFVTHAAANDMVDFNGDGFSDSVFFGPSNGSGPTLTIIYGQAGTLMDAETDVIYESDVSNETNGLSGILAPGNFNGDGYTDLAIGAFSARIGDLTNAGEIHILYGSFEGLSVDHQETLSQAMNTVQGVAEASDLFGSELVAGDFNGDGFDDLAAGTPHEDNEALNMEQSGAVHIFYGNLFGLRTDNELLITLDNPAVAADIHEWNMFGNTLEAADFNGDGIDDLAAAAPGYGFDPEIGYPTRQGMVMVFGGTNDGLSLASGTMWRQGFDGIQGAYETGDSFGVGLTSGDFDQNGVADLAVGSKETIDYDGAVIYGAGAVNIIYGYLITNGLSSAGNQMFHHGQADVWGEPMIGANFGLYMETADFNGDGADDLLVVADDYDVVDRQNAITGVVHVFHSNGNVLSTANQQVWLGEMLLGSGTQHDEFGVYTQFAADFNQDGFGDVALYSFNFPGYYRLIHILYGTNTGLSALNTHVCQQVNAIYEC